MIRVLAADAAGAARIRWHAAGAAGAVGAAVEIGVCGSGGGSWSLRERRGK